MWQRVGTHERVAGFILHSLVGRAFGRIFLPFLPLPGPVPVDKNQHSLYTRVHGYRHFHYVSSSRHEGSNDSIISSVMKVTFLPLMMKATTTFYFSMTKATTTSTTPTPHPQKQQQPPWYPNKMCARPESLRFPPPPPPKRTSTT